MNPTIWHIYVGVGQPNDGKVVAGAEQFVKLAEYEAHIAMLRAAIRRALPTMNPRTNGDLMRHMSTLLSVAARKTLGSCSTEGHFNNGVPIPWNPLDGCQCERCRVYEARCSSSQKEVRRE